MRGAKSVFLRCTHMLQALSSLVIWRTSEQLLVAVFLRALPALPGPLPLSSPAGADAGGGRVRCRAGPSVPLFGGAGGRGSFNPPAGASVSGQWRGIFVRGVCSPGISPVMVRAPPAETAEWWLCHPTFVSWVALNLQLQVWVLRSPPFYRWGN